MNTECGEKFVFITDSNIKKKKGLHHGKDGNAQVLGFSGQELWHKIPCSVAVYRVRWKEISLP